MPGPQRPWSRPEEEASLQQAVLSPVGLRLARATLCPVEPAAGVAGADLLLAGDSAVFLSVFCPDPRTFLLLDIVLAKFTGEHAGPRSSGDRPGSGWPLEMPV